MLAAALFLGALPAAAGGKAPQRPVVDGTKVERLQPVLLKAEISRLAPHRKGETDVYAIGVAGWPFDVFHKEVDGGLAAIGNVLPIKNRTLRLINHPATVLRLPLATPHNFAAAIHAVGQVMDRDRDIVILLLTSHGDPSGFALQLPGATIDLTPQELAAIFDREGIKNRVVIVSACFSGAFVPALENPNTIVMTAADASHTSFGCAPENDWTYFGDALFGQSLKPGMDFQSAFEHARVLIQGWELMDRLTPSNPQGFFGPALVAKLAPLFVAPPAGATPQHRITQRRAPAPKSAATPTAADRAGSGRTVPPN